MTNQFFRVLLQKIEPYLKKEGVNEIIFVEEKKFFFEKMGEYEEVEDENLNFEFLREFCIQLANSRGLNFNEAKPALSCSIPNTRYRVQALHQSITRNNQINLNIRIPSEFKFNITDFKLGEKCNFSYEAIKELVRNEKNILISGGTASGKTSFLNSLIDEIPLHQRVVTIEDSPELHVLNKNKTQILVSKNDNGKYNYEDALNSAMRLSPQRLLLGEIDTRNAMLFLRLGNTGHSGMISTIHANSPLDAIKAISLNIKMASGSKDIDQEVVEEYFRSAVDFIIQIKKRKEGRFIEEILSTKGLSHEN